MARSGRYASFSTTATLEARAGESLAAALLVAGIGPFRTTPVSDAPRQPYCMMGACFECLVEVDGVANRQACMVIVRRGHAGAATGRRGGDCNDGERTWRREVRSGGHRRRAGRHGRGDAGRRSWGLTTAILDEQPAPGGQIYRACRNRRRPAPRAAGATWSGLRPRCRSGCPAAAGQGRIPARCNGLERGPGSSRELQPRRAFRRTAGAPCAGGDRCAGAPGADTRLDAARRDDRRGAADPVQNRRLGAGG